MSKRNGAIGQETIDLRPAEPAEAEGGAEKVRVDESVAVICTAFTTIDELLAFAVLPRECMVSTMFFHR